MHPFLIDLDKVSYTPEGTSVLCDVTLQASERRIGIVGRNGSGKTSLARVLAGLVASVVVASLCGLTHERP